MATIAVFHSALGVLPGITDAADRLRHAGHEVHVIDQYGGTSFADYVSAGSHVEQIGFPALMRSALDLTADLPDGFLVAGFSNGAGMAEHVALHRNVAGALLFSGALPLSYLGADSWPGYVPVQLHFATSDPFRTESWVSELVRDVRASGAPLEFHEYAGSGHLFTDPSRSEEYDAAASDLLWQRVHEFLQAHVPSDTRVST